MISANSDRAATGMTSEALGVSVAPSFFHTCVSDGKTAKMEDVMRFKVRSHIVFLLGFFFLHLVHLFEHDKMRDESVDDFVGNITW